MKMRIESSIKSLNGGCFQIDSDQIPIVRVINPIFFAEQNYFNYISLIIKLQVNMKSTNVDLLEFSRTHIVGNVGIFVVSNENRLEIESIKLEFNTATSKLN